MKKIEKFFLPNLDFINYPIDSALSKKYQDSILAFSKYGNPSQSLKLVTANFMTENNWDDFNSHIGIVESTNVSYEKEINKIIDINPYDTYMILNFSNTDKLYFKNHRIKVLHITNNHSDYARNLLLLGHCDYVIGEDELAKTGRLLSIFNHKLDTSRYKE